MKISILLATAAVILSPLGIAQDPQDPQDVPEEPEDEWVELDRELESLGARKQEQEFEGPELWGYLRTNIAHRHFSNSGGGDENSTFGSIDNLRFNAQGSVGRNFRYRLTSEAQSGTMTIEDAWVKAAIGNYMGFTMGRFRTPFLRSGLIEAQDLLFIVRTRNGVYWSRRTDGAMLSGDHGRFHWNGALQNGADGLRDRFQSSLNATVDIIGLAPLRWEGAYEGGSTTRLNLGASITNDSASAADGDGTAYAIEGYLVHHRFSLQAEWMHYESAYSIPDPGEQRGGTSPWSITGSYMLVPKKYELALRFDEFDDHSGAFSRDRQTTTIGVNRYILGHDLKWQLNYAYAQKGGADDGPHENIIALGLTLAF